MLSLLISIRGWFFIFTSIIDWTDRQFKQQDGKSTKPIKKNPTVAVLVPAYNESVVLESSILSILRSDFENIEIIIVDDESTDCTALIATQLANTYNNVKLIKRSKNGGKAAALNTGIAASNADYIIIVDADTQLKTDAISKMVERAEQQPEVTAVACNVKVGNRKNMLTKLQSLEYIVGLNLARRTQHQLNSITTVPGAASLWRRDDILKLGGVPHGTRVEDTDLTIFALRRGMKLVYEPQAVAYTEAPTNWQCLTKQRIRWLGGYLQCIKKHGRCLLERGSLAWFGMPDLIFSNCVSFLILPFFFYSFFQSMAVVPASILIPIILLFFLMEVLLSSIAYLQDNENLSELIWVPLARIIWPLFLFAIFIRVLIVRFHHGSLPWLSAERQGDLNQTVEN